MKDEFDTMSELWKLLGLLLVGSFTGHTIVYNGETSPDDDAWLWLSAAIGMIYFAVGLISALQSK